MFVLLCVLENGRRTEPVSLGTVHSDDSGIATVTCPVQQAPAIVVSIESENVCVFTCTVTKACSRTPHVIIIVVIITCLVQSPVPRASPQLPVGRADVDSIVQLLRTTQETLIHGLTHSHLDVNYVGEQGMTLLHYAAMV